MYLFAVHDDYIHYEEFVHVRYINFLSPSPPFPPSSLHLLVPFPLDGYDCIVQKLYLSKLNGNLVQVWMRPLWSVFFQPEDL